MSTFINGIDRTPVNSLALLNAAAGNEVANRMDYTVNKAAGNDTGYVINKTDILSGGTSLIIDVQRNGTSVLTLEHKGKIIETVTLNAATGNEVAHTINYTVNKLTSGNDTGLIINQTDTASPGTSLLQDWQVGGVSVTSVSNGGTITSTSVDGIGVYGISTNNNGVYGLSTNSSGVVGWSTNSLGVYGNGANGGVSGVSINSYGVNGESTTNYGIYGSSVSFIAGGFVINPATTDTVAEILRLIRRTSGTAANNIGMSVDLYIEDSVGDTELTGRISNLLTNATSGAETSVLTFWTRTGGAAITEQMRIAGNGDITLTGRITPRVSTVASSATPTPAGDTTDVYTVTALAEAAAFGAPTGTPVEGQKLTIRIKDNATARALTWNAIYRAGTDVTLPTTTVISKTMYIGFIYNNTDTKWDLLAVTNNI